ncbi:GDP-mannose 4,6 dehydratase, partial [Pseudomonas syringae pv. tagetis]
VTHSLREVIDMCREISGQDIDVQLNPAFVRANEVKTLCGNIARLRALVHDWETPPLR